MGLLAVQGPRAQALLQPLTPVPLSEIGYYRFATGQVAGAQLLHLAHRIHRRGRLRALLPGARHRRALGGDHRRPGAPIGLGARDSLRLEMGYALYGNEIDDTITPLEAGLGWIVKLDKGAPFIGDAALRSQKQRGVTRKLVGFELEGRGFPRHGYPVYHEGREVDLVRSGTMSPSLGKGIGTTYLPAASARAGTRFEVECRGRAAPGGRRAEAVLPAGIGAKVGPDDHPARHSHDLRRRPPGRAARRLGRRDRVMGRRARGTRSPPARSSPMKRSGSRRRWWPGPTPIGPT